MTSINSVSIKDILPAYEDYALGMLIKKSKFKLHELEHNKKIFLAEEAEARAIKGNIVRPPIQASQEEKERAQKELSDAQTKLNRIAADIKTIDSQILELRKSDEKLGSRFEETLPSEYSRMVFEHRAFQSEKMKHLTIITKKNTNGNEGKEQEEGDIVEIGTDNRKGEIEHVVNDVIAQIFSTDSVNQRRLVPKDSLSGIKKLMERILQKEEEISLIASFITLSRVRRMDRITIRPSSINKRLKENARHYCVLTEAVMGAVFIGAGRRIASTGTGSRSIGMGRRSASTAAGIGSNEQKTNENSSRSAMISYISQGAIPECSKDFEDVNLYNVYFRWKDALKNDETTGYPIGFRYRELQDIFRDNNIKTPEEPIDDVSSSPSNEEEKEKAK